MHCRISATKTRSVCSRALAGAAILIAIHSIPAQVNLRGTVRDIHGAGVGGAAVWLKVANHRALTDTNGAYSIAVPNVGTRAGVVSSPGLGLAGTPIVRRYDITGRSVDPSAVSQRNRASRILVSNRELFSASATKSLARAEVAADTIVVTSRGLKSEFLPITALQGTYDFMLSVRPAGTRLDGMRYISGGTFSMGQTGIAAPVHNVTISPLYIDTTEVTQADYAALMNTDPSNYAAHPQNPVEEETWFDAVLYCNARSKKEGRDTVYTYSSVSGTSGNGCQDLVNIAIHFECAGYRLSTEAEWEYACRAGSITNFYWGNNPDMTYCWTSDNSGWHTNMVATKKPNAWGLYDMSGNCWEWCGDISGAYSSASQIDPTGATTGTNRIMRGGAFHEASTDTRLYSASRNPDIPTRRDNNVGFRCVFSDQ